MATATQPSDGADTRVPPHSIDAEVAVLGAVMLQPAAFNTAVDIVDAADFYGPNHALIWQTIVALESAGEPFEPTSVSIELERRGRLDQVGGRPALVEIATDSPVASRVARYARIVSDRARARRLIAELEAAADAAWKLDPDRAAELAAAASTTATAGGTESTWAEVDLTGVLDGSLEPPEPLLLARTDNQALLYLGKTHALNAESESGKSWLACLACAQAIAAGFHVAYVDFEDDAASVTGRLVAIGVTPADLVDRFHYVRPDGDPIDAAARTHVMGLVDTHDISLAVLDGVTEAMVGSGMSINDNDDVARFYDALARPIAAAGASVLLVDHVVKDKEGRGRFAIGAQHKLAGITGASYGLEVVEPFGQGRIGRARIVVMKDRPGQVRGYAVEGKHVGELRIASRGGGAGQVEVSIIPATRHQAGEVHRPTTLMELLSRACADLCQLNPERPPSLNTLLTQVHGKKDAKNRALLLLEQEGYIATIPGANRARLHRHIKPYSAELDPESDRYNPPAPPDDQPSLDDF